MDVTLLGRCARLGGTMLALLAVSPAWAVAADSNSVIVVGDEADDGAYIVADDAPAPAAAPAESSRIVVQNADNRNLETPPVAAPAAARGTLTVVANGAQRGAVIVDPSVTPAGSLEGVEGAGGGLFWGAMMGSGPRRPAMSAGIQTRGRSGRPAAGQAVRPRRQQFAPVAPPVADAPLAFDAQDAVQPADPVAAPAVQRIKSPVDHAKSLLVKGYQLSLSASTESEFSQIIQWCATAMRADLDVETRNFSNNLSAWALNRRGQARADEGQSDLALADFRAALEFAPDNWRALHNRAVTMAQNGQFAEAFDDVSRVIQLNPKFAKAYSNRATLYVQAGDFERALRDYDAALLLEPGLLAAHTGRGRLCHIQGRLGDALASLDAAVKLEPNNAEVRCSRADLLADLGRYEEALLEYAEAIDLNGKLEHAYRNGAWLLATCPDEEIRDADGALVGAQAALECGYGERHAALDTLAAALANAGRFDDAVDAARQAIEVAPEDARAAYEARLKLYEAGQPFRTSPVGAPTTASAATSAPENQQAVYEEE